MCRELFLFFCSHIHTRIRVYDVNVCSYTNRRGRRSVSSEQTALDTIGESKEDSLKSSEESETSGILLRQNSDASKISIGSGGSDDDLRGLIRTKGLSDDCIDFLVRILNVRTNERASARSLVMHPWLTDEIEDKFDVSELHINVTSPGMSRSNSMNGFLQQISSSPIHTDIVNSIEISSRERHLIEEFNISTGHTHDIHLPPLEPATPSVGKVRKMLQIGKDAVSAAVKGETDDAGSTQTSPKGGIFSK